MGFRDLACEQEEYVTFTARSGLVWLGMILAGLVLGGYVLSAWPDTSSHLVRLPYGEAMPKTPAATPQTIRKTASVTTYPESELAGVLGEIYPLELYYYELVPAPLLDALIAAPQPVDAH
jgi:hypothetical protein